MGLAGRTWREPLGWRNPGGIVPTELTTGSAAKPAGHKTREIGFLESGFAIPFAAVLGQFSPKIIIYLYIYYLAAFKLSELKCLQESLCDADSANQCINQRTHDAVSQHTSEVVSR